MSILGLDCQHSASCLHIIENIQDQSFFYFPSSMLRDMMHTMTQHLTDPVQIAACGVCSLGPPTNLYGLARDNLIEDPLKVMERKQVELWNVESRPIN